MDEFYSILANYLPQPYSDIAVRLLKDLRAEVERLKTEAKALKGNWAGTWVNECEYNDTLKERAQLRAALERIASDLDTGGDCLTCAYDGFIYKEHEKGCAFIVAREALRGGGDE